MTTRNHYITLEVPQTASPDEISKAYKRIARRTHPDTHPGDKEAERIFKAATEAYGILGDEAKRKNYDDELGGRRRAAGPNAGDISRWTPEKSDEWARRIRDGRRLGEEAAAQGDTYLVDWVTFGTGDSAVSRATLTCNGEVLEKDPQAPSSHPAASEATHKRFAAAHTDVQFELAASAGKRADWAKAVTDLRTRLCEGDAGLGEGNTVHVNGNTYSVAIVPYGSEGRWQGQRVLMRNGRSLENLPSDAVWTNFASASDFDVFFTEQDMVAGAIERFLETRDDVSKQAATMRSDLDPGDAVTVNGTTYAFEWIEWRGPQGKPTLGMVLCADHVPLEKLPGRAINKAQRGADLDMLWKFQDDAKDVDGLFRQLKDARVKLRNAAMTVMKDLYEGDRMPWGSSELHVEKLNWATAYSTGSDLTLCFGPIAINPHWGTITSEGYRRATAAEAANMLQGAGFRGALRPIVEPRAYARQQEIWRQQDAAIRADRERAEAERLARREQRGHRMRGIGRFLGGRGGDEQQGEGGPDAGGGFPPPQSQPEQRAEPQPMVVARPGEAAPQSEPGPAAPPAVAPPATAPPQRGPGAIPLGE